MGFIPAVAFAPRHWVSVFRRLRIESMGFDLAVAFAAGLWISLSKWLRSRFVEFILTVAFAFAGLGFKLAVASHAVDGFQIAYG